jgi:hypothetical protein
MKNSRLDKESLKTEKNKKRFSKLTAFGILGAVVAALIGIGTLTFSQSSATVVASAIPQPTPKGQKKYKATKNIIVDRETGQTRKPNEQELNDLVQTLSTLTERSADNTESVSASSAGEFVAVEDGFAGVVLSRPLSDGTFETRCVFTLEEGAAFLGLEEDNSTE